MSIKINNAPSASFDALKSKAQSLHHELITYDENGDQHHYIPHKIYDVNIYDLADGGDLSTAEQVAWRYIIKDANGHDHVAEIGINEVLDEHNLHFINTGRHVNNFLAIYERLHDHEHVEDKDYEIHMVRISPVFVLAVWLKGVDHSHEFFIPVAPVNNKFEANKTYSYEEFLSLLQEVSREYLRIEDPADDLTRIEGIGPKIAEVLKNANFNSFKSIAEANMNEIEKVLTEAGTNFNLAIPQTWPEQAGLALDGKWEELAILQKKLKGGRR